MALTFPRFRDVAPAAVAAGTAERRALLRAGGSFWSVSLTVAHLLTPTEGLAAIIESEARSIGLHKAPRPVLSLHIRHGDSCSDPRRFRKESKASRILSKASCRPLAQSEDRGHTRPKADPNAETRTSPPYGIGTCSNVSEYAHLAVQLAARYGFRSLFAMSDSAAAMDALPGALAQHGWPAHAPVLTRRDDTQGAAHRSMAIEDAMGRGVIEPCGELAALLTDLHLAARAEGFIGKFTSNMGRLVYSLMAARMRCAPVYVSLDAAWCFGSRGWSPDGGAIQANPHSTLEGAPSGAFGCGP